MACRTPRKGPRRPPRKDRGGEDSELDELASVLIEHTLDQNARGWFRLPWRNGWNTVELALEAANLEALRGDTLVEHQHADWLTQVIHAKDRSQPIYWEAQDLLAPHRTSRMFRAALRCLQVLIAESHGGGEVYNAILLPPFESNLPEDVTDLVLTARCRDSIGVGPHTAGDGNDRLRRAFMTAWKRGLYHAAYALPPAKTSNKLSVV